MKKTLLWVLLTCFSVSFAQEYTYVIENHLTTNGTQYGLSSSDTNDFSISSQSYSRSMGLDNVYIIQRVQGIEIITTSSSLAIKNGVVASTALNFIANSNQKINTVTPSITAQNAIVRAAAALGLPVPNSTLLETITSQKFVFSDGGISLDTIPVQLVFQPMEDGSLKLAWDLSIYLLNASHYYSIRVDAVNGSILSQNDWVVSCSFGATPHVDARPTKPESSILFGNSNDYINFSSMGGISYRVFPVPVESPNHGTDQLVIDPSNAVASPFGWHDEDGVAGPEYTITRGNNVLARDDIDGNNTGGFSPDGGPTLTFDFPFNFNTNPVNMLSAATTNLFYWNNIVHDVFYQYGFDEASGNFQENNYGNGGSGNDFVDAQAQDGGGTNNANFATPPDGNNPRMQMFLWNAQGPAGTPLTILNGTPAGDYTGVPALFGTPLPEDTPVTGQIIVVEDNNDGGESSDTSDACDTIINGASMAGNIAIIRRGTCQFGFKVLAAENQGAIAVIVVNNEPGAPFGMAPGDQGGQVTIPSIMISQADGEAIVNAVSNNEILNGSLINAGPFQLDGDVDNGIIAHEYGHGISNRLTGGRFNTGCLSNDEQMGEGWSDYFGLMLTMKETDQRGNRRGVGTYAIGQPTDGGGIREAPYSTDFGENDYTYADTDGNVSVPHGVGFVWATMLWEMTWDLIDEYGFDPDLYNGTGGNNIAIQLVVDGLKLQACSPGFVDGRDAILEADRLANDGANQCLIWEAFARRGLGVSASQGSPFSLSDGEEAFDVPSTANCLLNSEDRGSIDTNIMLYPNPANGVVSIRGTQVSGDATVSIFDINGSLVLSQTISLQNTATINVEGFTTGVYLVKIEGGSFTDTLKLIIE